MIDMEFFDASLVLAKLDKRKSTVIEFLKLKIEEESWREVQDAAMSLRELEAECKVWKKFVRSSDTLSDKYKLLD